MSNPIDIQSFLVYNDFIQVDYLKIGSAVKTREQAEKEIKKTSLNTVMYNDFLPFLNATLFNLEDEIPKDVTISLYKRTPDKLILTHVATLEGGDYLLKDYNVVNDGYYQYLVLITATFGQGDNIEKKNYIYWTTDPSFVKASWDSWSICDIILEKDDEETGEKVYRKSGNVWNFKLNISADQIEQNLSITPWETLGKYGQVSIGKKDYSSGQVQTFLGDMREYYLQQLNEDGKIVYQQTDPRYTYTEKDVKTELVTDSRGNKKYYKNVVSYYSSEMEKYKKWKKFCANGETKLLKDIAGNAWIVQISNSTSANISTASMTPMTQVSFQWQEVEDINEVSIIGQGVDE